MIRKRFTEELHYSYCPRCKNALEFLSIEDRSVLSCSKCLFIFWNNPKPVVSALIIKDSKVLLINRKSEIYNNYWAFPGGIIDFLEEPKEALKREVFEEIGLNVIKAELIDAYLIVYAPKGLDQRPSHTSIDLIYKTEIEKYDLKKSRINKKEVNDIRFFSFNQLPKKIAFKHINHINKYFNNT